MRLMFWIGTHSESAMERKKITRPVVSEEDGTREGGLVFVIVLIGGFIGATLVSPFALTSFWVWFALLMMSIASASGTQRLVARWNRYEMVEDDT